MPRARLARSVAVVVVVALSTAIASASVATAAKAPWARKIDALIGERPMSVAVGNDGEVWAKHLPWVRRAPASNEKLLLSMALFDAIGTERTIRTELQTGGRRSGGTLDGNVWLVGRGDPEIDDHQLGVLARQVAEAGIRRIRGSVKGSRGAFVRDWWAAGWREYFPSSYIALPTALTYRGNRDRQGRHISDPERRAARALTAKLEKLGVRVTGRPGDGVPRTSMRTIAEVSSGPIAGIVRRMNVPSRNFAAEVLGKYLGARVFGRASIATGARAIEAFAARHGVTIDANDASGLSYANRTSATGILQLLWVADAEPWGPALRASLARGGEGTLADRLRDVQIRAKTGTLEAVSALSGWVWLETSDEWAEFSILSSGMSTAVAKTIENKIVRLISNNASDPTP
ncbi:MAG TPA: D-alanyl-D-alanine carboxypeptidase [Actinomycetota bacterium]|nr:D-alanyl-D-alanine carboxypeptidase [Actinomycetota bacterium]